MAGFDEEADMKVAVVFLLWFGSGNSAVTVSGIASEQECQALAMRMNAASGNLLSQPYTCIPYSAADAPRLGVAERRSSSRQSRRRVPRSSAKWLLSCSAS
jgi:hypothetical protein